MSALPVTITDSGWQKYLAAQLDPDIDLNVAQIALTATAFTPARTLTALPGESRRLTNMSGQVAGVDTIHLTASDSGAASYTIRGFALVLEDGTLFAVYGQEGVIVEKSAAASLLLALDIKMQPQLVSQITFGDATFVYPPATELVKGVAELATQAETDAGADDQRIVTPLKLKGRLTAVEDAVAARALRSVKLSGGGLVTGGGDLTANRTLTVLAASGAEADAGQVDSKALTPASIGNLLIRVTEAEGAIAARALRSVQLSAGGLVTGGGDLAGNRGFTVEPASAAEASAGVINHKALTPASIGNLIAEVASRAPASRNLSAGGLVTGGGNLTADRGFTVEAASVAELRAAEITTKALTPHSFGGLSRVLEQNGHYELPGGFQLIWGRFTASANSNTSVTFPLSFPTQCYVVTAGGGQTASIDNNSVEVLTNSITASGFQVNNSCPSSVAGSYIALGR